MTSNSRSRKKPPALAPRGAARVIPEGVPSSARDDSAGLVEHPDGWYWVAPDGHQQFGPFTSPSEALADRDAGSDAADGEALFEAEDAIGIANWIDADTGAPAEGQSPPHLEVD